jgi:hypothetical protein
MQWKSSSSNLSKELFSDLQQWGRNFISHQTWLTILFSTSQYIKQKKLKNNVVPTFSIIIWPIAKSSFELQMSASICRSYLTLRRNSPRLINQINKMRQPSYSHKQDTPKNTQVFILYNNVQSQQNIIWREVGQ